MTPVIIGLILAIPLTQWSASIATGKLLRRMRLLLVPEESQPPDILLRANALVATFAATERGSGAFKRLFGDCALTAAHRALLPAAQPRRRGDVDVTRVVARAKLDDCATLDDADDVLTRPEKMAVLCDAESFARLAALATG